MEPCHSRVLQYLVVDVEVSLTGVLGHNTTFLQQEVGNLASIRSSPSTELDLKVFPLWGVHKRTDIQVDQCPHVTSGPWSHSQKTGGLTNLLELLFRTVFAFPKASSRGLDWRMMSLTCYIYIHTHTHSFSGTVTADRAGFGPAMTWTQKCACVCFWFLSLHLPELCLLLPTPSRRSS